jgi:hypothetical protein
MWTLVPIPDTDYVRIQNRWYPERSLHAESGDLEAGPIEDGWWSAMWAIDDLFATDARSVTLWYPTDEAKAFTIEVTPIESQPGTYFAGTGFDGGYFGMQELVDGSKLIIFSIWDNATGDDREVVPADRRATRVQLGSGVTAPEFGDEGTGQSARLMRGWSDNQTVTFTVTAAAAGDATKFSAYFDDGTGWTFIGTLSRPKTGGRLLTGFYSFVEDFNRNGATEGIDAEKRSPYQHHVGHFSNPWWCSAQGGWSAIRDATFTAHTPEEPAEGDPKSPLLLNIDATLLEDRIGFELATGGFWVQRTDLGATLHSKQQQATTPSLPTAE